MTTNDQWLEFVKAWRYCQECPLCTQRSHIVLARGTLPADVLFLGEAPGVSEDTSGLPFDGPAGALLDQIVAEATAQWPDVTIAYTNLVCCLPREAKQTNDHRPTADEIKACSPRLAQFVEIVNPKLVVTVGTLATEWAPITAQAGDVHWCGIAHPAAILRMPGIQKGMAVRNAVTQVRDAVERALYVAWACRPSTDDDAIPF